MKTYCERCGPGLFDEPLNAITNIVFLIAAWVAWRQASRLRVLTPGLGLLILLSMAVGIGSALWHTFATSWALVLDVVPIVLFQLVFFWLYGRQVLRWPAFLVLVGLIAYLAAGLALREYREWLNGGLIYLPTVALCGAAGVHWWQTSSRERWLLPLSAGIFCLSLTCRSIDLIVCRQLPIGTHFLWHFFNGWVLYAAMRALILTYERSPMEPELEV